MVQFQKRYRLDVRKFKFASMVLSGVEQVGGWNCEIQKR